MFKMLLEKIGILGSEAVIRSKDNLTNLHSHNSFYDVLLRKVQVKEDFSLLMIDVNNFKLFNITKGFAKGDEILKGIGAVLTQVIRETDWAFRYGGDEFAVLLPYTGKKVSKAIANRIQSELNKYLKSKDSNLGISIGIATILKMLTIKKK